MELHLFVNRERENLFLARQISTRQRGAVMAFIPNHTTVLRLDLKIRNLKVKVASGVNFADDLYRLVSSTIEKNVEA